MIDFICRLGDTKYKSTTIEELYKEVFKENTMDGFSADVTIKGDAIHVHVDDNEFMKAYQELEAIRRLCELSQFDEAEPRLYRLLKKHPYNSEAYRLLAQIQQLNGDATRALDLLLDALRCDPKNVWALLLMGNILQGEFNDPKSALSYYQQVCDIEPDNIIAISNIGSIYSRFKEYDAAKEWYRKVLQKDNTLETVYHGLAMAYVHQDDYNRAFEWARRGLVHGVPRPENPGITAQLRQIMVESATKIDDNQYINIYEVLKEVLERDNKPEIIPEEDENLDVYAQFKYGPLRGEKNHKIVYNPNHPYLPHILVHELLHYEMMHNLENEGKSWMVVHMTEDNDIEFTADFYDWYNDLLEEFGDEEGDEIAENVKSVLFLQVMSCPLDLFVEQRMFIHFKDMRPIQMLSMIAEEQDNIKKMQDAVNADYLHDSILSAIRIMNVVSSMQLEKLYGLRLYDQYNASEEEMEQARDFYAKFEEYIATDGSYTHGDEYALMRYIIDQVGFSRLITLTPHNEYIKGQYDDLADFLKFMPVTALDEYESSDEGGKETDADTELRQIQQDNFYAMNKDGEDDQKTMMMTMYMVGALETFHNQSDAFIGRVACEIAQIGMTGIIPEEKGYVVTMLDNKEMSGYQLLAYYYVSWKLFNEEFHKILNLPFDTAWTFAKEIFDRTNG